jgi:chromate transporter
MKPNSNSTASLSDIFFSFLRLGATAFGGPAIVPHIRAMAVEQKGWVDEQTFDNGNAMAQVVPGAISVQVAAYTGLQIRGLAGACAACTGYILPSFLLMLFFSALYERWHEGAGVAAGFGGLRAVVIALLAHAAFLAGRDYIKNKSTAAVALGAGLLFGFRINPVFVILAAGLTGWLLFAAPCRAPAAGLRQIPARFRHTVLLLAAVAAGCALLYLLDGTLFPLALLMAKIDLFAFGGGYTSVPLMFHEIVEVRGWLDGKTLLDGIALGQLTPGPIVITATFVGYLLKGVVGAAAATICIFLPSILIVVMLSPAIDRLRHKKGFGCFITGILCSFVGLLVSTVYHFSRHVDWSWGLGLIAAAAFAALCARMPILFVLTAGIAAAVVLL